jgi:gamma-glutamyltranspeptidase/glutathione hydrolase
MPALPPPLARRAVAAGTLGAVAAGSATAAALGSAAFDRGGNAVDAALTAALAETVLLPPKCGLAGDLVALVRPAGATAPEAIVAIGPAAAGLPALAERTGWRLMPTGGPAVGVPGAPAGYAALGRYARLPMIELAAPAIALAKRGIVWSAVCARLAAEAADLLRTHQPDGCVYQPEGTALLAGSPVRLPGLAYVLEEFATRQESVFAGELGDRLVAYVAAHGGVLTKQDLATARAETAPAVAGTVRGRRLWVTPSPTYGPALLDCLDTVGPGPVTPEAVGAALDRLRGREPSGALAGGTSAVAAVDTDGTAVVIVHSNSFPQFGSGLVVPGLDLVLSNRAGRGFTFQAGHPNAPAKGRRPLTTLHAWGLAGPDGELGLLGATPGGEQQVPWNAQLLDALLALPDTLEALGTALTTPRWELTPDGRVASEAGAAVDADVVLRDLAARSSHVVVRPGAGSVAAAADPRLDGAAVAR